MKTFYLAATAALLLASTAAQAGGNGDAGGNGNSVSFEIDGQRVRIQAPKHCDSLNCIQISAPGLSKSGFNLKGLNFGKSDDDDTADSTPPAKSAPAPAAAPSAPASTAAPQMQAAVPAPAPASTTPAPVVNDVVPATPPPAPAPVPQSAAAAAAPAAAPAAIAANTPVGIWKTEDDKGNVRIEQCGADLCGYAVGSGEKILINMRPEESRWVGRIHDPDSGRNYDSTVTMKGTNTLHVQGCAFGGLFCGGQTWKRVS
jgi:Uncharacterized protein conserved in bacteria (DUF2147)